MAAKEISVKKYVVRVSADEREQLSPDPEGKSPAQRLLKARILLKADVWKPARLERQPDHQGAGDQPIHGLSGAQAVGGGRLRGRVEPQATGDACGGADFRRREGSQTDYLGLFQPPKGRARWTLRLLENKVVKLGIVDRATD